MTSQPTPRLEALEARVVPAVVYVDDSLVITTDQGPAGLSAGDTVTFNQGDPGEVAGLIFGQTAFDGLASAVNAAQANDTLLLASGTYSVAPGLVIDKSLSIQGLDLAATRIVPTADTGVEGATRALIRVAPAINFNVLRLTIDGTSSIRTVAEAIRFDGGNGTIQGVSFENIGVNSTLSPNDGIAIAAQNGEVFVRDSRFTDVGRTGVLASGPAMRLGYESNVSTGSGGGNRVQIGVEVSAGATAIISGSRFTLFQGASLPTAAVFVDSTAAPNSTLMLIGNELEQNVVALRIGSIPTDSSRVGVRLNNFVGNTTAVTSSAAPVDAGNNYWGSATGPRSPSNPGGVGDVIDARTTFAPFNTQRLKRAVGSTPDEYLARARTPLAVAAGQGGSPIVAVYDADGNQTQAITAYDPRYLGGVNVALGDINGDGIADIVTGAASGVPHVKVFDGGTGREIASFFAFDPASGVGVTVAVGDVDGDGFNDIILGAGAGGLPIVRVFQGATGLYSRAFLAFDAGFRGGVSVATADLEQSGRDLILASPLRGGVPVVRKFDVSGEVRALADLLAFDASFLGGVSIASGDIDGDGIPDLIAATSGNGVSQIRVLSGRDGGGLRDLFAGETRSRGGARASAQSVSFTAAEILVYAAPERAGTRVVLQRLDGNGVLRALTPFDKFAGPLDVA